MKQKNLAIVGLFLALALVLFAFWYRHRSPQSSDYSPARDYSGSEESTKAGKEQPENKKQSSQILFNEAKTAYQKKDLKTAATLISQAAAKGKGAEIMNLWGNILRDQGKKDEAKTKYREAIKLDKHFVVAYLNLSTLYQEEENYDQALAVVNEGLEYNPSNQDLLNSKNLIEILKSREQ